MPVLSFSTTASIVECILRHIKVKGWIGGKNDGVAKEVLM